MRRRSFLYGLPLLAAPGSAAPPAAPVTGLAFSPDGRLLLSSGYRELLVRSVPDLRVVRRLPCTLGQIHSLVFSPGGDTLAAAGGTPGSSGSVQFFSWPSGRPAGAAGRFGDLATGLAFSADGGRLAVSSASGEAVVWEAARARGGQPGPPLLTLSGHAGPVTAILYLGNLLVTASADRSLRVWDARTGAMLRALTNHTDLVHCAAARPPSAGNANPEPYCASGSDDRTARVWQPGIGRMVRIVRGHSGPVLAVCYSRDGRHLFSAGSEGVVRVIDADSDQILRSWKPGGAWIYRLALSPDGRRLAAGDASGRVFLEQTERLDAS